MKIDTINAIFENLLDEVDYLKMLTYLIEKN